MLRKVPILSIFLSTLSLRRATYQDKFSIPSDNISIHALLAESDGTGFFVLDERHDISIHALLAESDTPTLESLTPTQTFLSTLSLRRATAFFQQAADITQISIHALLAESDLIKNHIFFCHSLFLSTLSLRRATFCWFSLGARVSYFYPRSPCGERRPPSAMLSSGRAYFYPRSPCGERRKCSNALQNRSVFLSTLSLRRATPGTSVFRGWTLFLSTLSLRRATLPISRGFSGG